MDIQAQKNAKGDVVKHKARLVAKGFTQQYGVDYLETFPQFQDMKLSDYFLLLLLKENGNYFNLMLSLLF